MLPKVQRSAEGCLACKIVLKTKKSAQKKLSETGKGLSAKVLYISRSFTCLHVRKTHKRH